MLARPKAARIPSISALRLNITALYTVDANGTSAVVTFQLRSMMPIRLALLELCYKNQYSDYFSYTMMRPSGVALASPLLQPGKKNALWVMLPPSGSGQKILPPWNQYAAA